MQTFIEIAAFVLIVVPLVFNGLTEMEAFTVVNKDCKKKGTWNYIREGYLDMQGMLPMNRIRPIFRPLINTLVAALTAIMIIFMFIVSGHLLYLILVLPIDVLRWVVLTKETDSSEEEISESENE